MAGTWLVWGEVALAAIGLAPFAIHRLACGRWAKAPMKIPDENSALPITVLLPVWNESLIIEKKLSALASQDVDVNLLLVDSASDDETLVKAKSWLRDYPDAFLSHEIIQMEKRLGKTPAVMLALDNLQDFDGIILMTDADATMMPGAISRIQRWFSDPTIGAVGGTPNRTGDLHSEKTHRNMYTLLRIGESSRDSTPFLEGSLMAWRSNLVESSDLHATANADDAQIATAIRVKGMRTIQDGDLEFTDQMPTTSKGQRRQKVRRAQGLIRLLARKRKHWFSRRLGGFSTILRRNAWMHIFSPFAIAGAGILALLRTITYLPDSNLMYAMSAIEIYCLLAWLTTRFGKPIPMMRTVGAILYGLENLLTALLVTGRGKSLHMWEQHSDVREVLSE